MILPRFLFYFPFSSCSVFDFSYIHHLKRCISRNDICETQPSSFLMMIFHSLWSLAKQKKIRYYEEKKRKCEWNLKLFFFFIHISTDLISLLKAILPSISSLVNISHTLTKLWLSSSSSLTSYSTTIRKKESSHQLVEIEPNSKSKDDVVASPGTRGRSNLGHFDLC